MTNLSSEDLLSAALTISAEAQSIPLRYFRSQIPVEDKADSSPVTVADRETEEHIRSAISERFPSHGIYGEEFGVEVADSAFVWVIDPIDGTKSFISGSPLFGMLLGVLDQGSPQAGVIRMPALGECFAGHRNGTATLNGSPISCRRVTNLSEARIYLNEADLMMQMRPSTFERLFRTGKLSRFAYDCYSFGLLAMGEIDAVIDFDLKPYDFLPVVPVIEAAGGVITDWDGQPLGLRSDGTVAAAGTRELHRALLEILHATR